MRVKDSRDTKDKLIDRNNTINMYNNKNVIVGRITLGDLIEIISSQVVGKVLQALKDFRKTIEEK